MGASSFAYCLDGREFIGDFKSDAEAACEAFKRNSGIQSVLVGEVYIPKAVELVDINGILECISRRAAEENSDLGEFWLAEHMTNESTELKEELISVIGSTLQSICPPEFTSIRNVNEILAPARQDIADADKQLENALARIKELESELSLLRQPL